MQTNTTSPNTSDKIQELRTDLRTLGNDAAQVGRSAIDAGRAAAEEGRAKVGEIAEKASDFASNKYEQIKSAGCSTTSHVEDYVRSNPLKAVAIAGLAGFFLSAFSRRS